MECPNCTFQNIPGTRACVRCATLLDFSGVDVDPPRASSGRMGRQTRAAALEVSNRYRAGATRVSEALRLPQLRRIGVLGLVQGIVPGLPQMLSDSMALRGLGVMILIAWAAALSLALLTIGTGFSMLMCFAAISIHTATYTLLLAPDMESTPLAVRIGLGISMYFAVMLLFYAPFYAVGERVFGAVPVNGVGKNPALANGDVLFRTGAWTTPDRYQRGDLVLCQLGPQTAAGAYVLAGHNIDRVVAVAGDDVRIAKGVLTVNGAILPDALGPLGGTVEMPDCAFTVEQNHAVVFPSILNVNRHLYQRMDTFLNSSVLPLDAIEGRVFFRVRPWSRLGVPGASTDGGSE